MSEVVVGMSEFEIPGGILRFFMEDNGYGLMTGRVAGETPGYEDGLWGVRVICFTGANDGSCSEISANDPRRSVPVLDHVLMDDGRWSLDATRAASEEEIIEIMKEVSTWASPEEQRHEVFAAWVADGGRRGPGSYTPRPGVLKRK